MPTHAERRLIAYSPSQLFELVADVGKYPQFLPWCTSARVRTRTATDLVADLTIGFGPFRETFTSRVLLEAPGTIRVRFRVQVPPVAGRDRGGVQRGRAPHGLGLHPPRA